MELAYHPRCSDRSKWIEKTRNSEDFVSSLLPSEIKKKVGGSENKVNYLYLGDEFCVNLLPDIHDMKTLNNMIPDSDLHFTLVTPPLTDQELNDLLPVADRFFSQFNQPECVVNDWGFLEYTRNNYPDVKISAGRLLNKAFKDPRKLDSGRPPQADSSRLEDLFGSCTFEHPDAPEMLRYFGIERVETDLPPYGAGKVKHPGNLGLSIYFPYGVVTMGRFCGIASFLRTVWMTFDSQKTAQKHAAK